MKIHLSKLIIITFVFMLIIYAYFIFVVWGGHSALMNSLGECQRSYIWKFEDTESIVYYSMEGLKKCVAWSVISAFVLIILFYIINFLPFAGRRKPRFVKFLVVSISVLATSWILTILFGVNDVKQKYTLLSGSDVKRLAIYPGFDDSLVFQSYDSDPKEWDRSNRPNPPWSFVSEVKSPFPCIVSLKYGFLAHPYSFLWHEKIYEIWLFGYKIQILPLGKSSFWSWWEEGEGSSRQDKSGVPEL